MRRIRSDAVCALFRLGPARLLTLPAQTAYALPIPFDEFLADLMIDIRHPTGFPLPDLLEPLPGCGGLTWLQMPSQLHVVRPAVFDKPRLTMRIINAYPE